MTDIPTEQSNNETEADFIAARVARTHVPHEGDWRVEFECQVKKPGDWKPGFVDAENAEDAGRKYRARMRVTSHRNVRVVRFLGGGWVGVER